ncbi:MAG: flavin monoamine oxidase family protein [Steroidobacteraceae bacterium]
MPVTRRRSIALGVAAAFGATTTWLRAETSKKYDVIVIGAGFSGLHAARLLAADGLTVLVLESDRRVGGRSHTAYEFDSRIELGASQVGRMYARILDTARGLGIEMAPGAHINAPYSFVLGDELIAAKDWSVSKLNPLQGPERSVPPHALGAYYIEQRNPFQSLDEVHAAAAAEFDLSVAEWLARQNASPAAIHLINHTLGAPGLENQSVLRMFQEATRMRVENRARAAEAAKEPPGKDAYERAALNSFHVVGGSSKLTDAMAASLGDRVITGKKVVSIDMTDTDCTVRCEDGSQWRSSRVISALPFTMLRQIAITPALQGTQADAVRRMPYGNQSQVWLRVKAPYWEADGIEASMWTDGIFTLIRQQIEHDGKRELISALAFGKKSYELDRLSPQERGALAIRYIEQRRPSTRGKLEFIGAHSWAQAPTIGGCSYGLQPQAAFEWNRQMSKPHARLHFAGEHTRRFEVGMEAAMESGERAALEVLQS